MRKGKSHLKRWVEIYGALDKTMKGSNWSNQFSEDEIKSQSQVAIVAFGLFSGGATGRSSLGSLTEGADMSLSQVSANANTHIHTNINRNTKINTNTNTNTITDTNRIIKLQNDMTGGMCFLLLTGGDEEKLSCVQRCLHLPIFKFLMFSQNLDYCNSPNHGRPSLCLHRVIKVCSWL